jgi:hypothetical protein
MVKGLIALIRTVREPELRGLALFVLTLFGAGTVFYTVVEDWSVLDALYFSVMTLLTVGYGDLVPTTDANKVFTMLYVIVGAGALVAFVTVVARQAAGLPLPQRKGPDSKSYLGPRASRQGANSRRVTHWVVHGEPSASLAPGRAIVVAGGAAARSRLASAAPQPRFPSPGDQAPGRKRASSSPVLRRVRGRTTAGNATWPMDGRRSQLRSGCSPQPRECCGAVGDRSREAGIDRGLGVHAGWTPPHRPGHPPAGSPTCR